MSIFDDIGNGMMAKAIRDISAVAELVSQCKAVKDNDLPSPVAKATSAVTSLTVTAVPTFQYDNVDTEVTDAKGAIQIPLVDYAKWQQDDVVIQLHFVIQAARWATLFNDANFLSQLRSSTSWQTIRMGLHIYFSLLHRHVWQAAVRYEEACSGR